MDDPTRRRRHNEPPAHQNPTSRFAFQDPSQPSRSLTSGTEERYRPAPPNTSPSTPRGIGGAGSYSSYYQEPTAAFSSATMPATGMGYSSDYSHDGRQQQAQGQGFGGYNTAAMMYNVAQPNPQTPVYDAQQFGQRQSAAMQMITPDVASSYFSPEAGSGSASSLQPSAQSTGASANVYQTPSMSYSSNMPASSAMQQTPGSADVSMGEDHDYPDGALEEKWVNYQRQLGTIFQDIANGSLESASETLLSISSWLLPQVADLGLNLDDANLHADRLKLWNDFNHAWLGLGHRQREMMTSGRQLSRGQRLMSEDRIKKIGNELVRLCDGIERHGLVDYQYGVWEEEIESVLEDCLDLFEPPEEAGANEGSR